MKLVTFSTAGATHVGVLFGNEVIDLTAAGVATTMLEIVKGGEAILAKARATKAPKVALSSVRLLTPLPNPSKILCSGVNYKDHAAEGTGKIPEEPFFFAKVPSSVAGPEDKIAAPAITKQLDWEVEFAVVVGKRLFKAKPEEVMPALFGYTMLNDVSARDIQFKDSQITLGKNFEHFAPIGPCIVTADEMTQPDKVRVTTHLNGKLMQDANTADWIFPLPRLISFLSQVMPLEPGDIVSTGTPAGTGGGQHPPLYMKPGDVIEIAGEGVGSLRNYIVA
jgi:2-keto-4-pentenoate hydratase/2-oxohepta-3-ene-1,7-dioic acid hydratase in catechol pathway